MQSRFTPDEALAIPPKKGSASQEQKDVGGNGEHSGLVAGIQTGYMIKSVNLDHVQWSSFLRNAWFNYSTDKPN